MKFTHSINGNNVDASKVTRLFISNLLFIGSTATTIPFLLFYHGHSVESFEKTILIGLAIFSGVQFSGAWFVEKLKLEFLYNRNQHIFCRLVAIFLLYTPNDAAIIAGSFLFGITYAIFYKSSRSLASHSIDNFPLKKIFFLLSLSANLAYFFFPLVSGYMVQEERMLLPLLSCLTTVISIALINSIPRVKSLPSSEIKEDYDVIALPSQEKKSKFIVDSARIISAVLPFTAMFAALQLQSSTNDLDSHFYSMILGLNAVIVICIQLVIFWAPIWLKQIFLSRSPRFYLDCLCLLSMTCFLSIPFLSINAFIILFLGWSVVEALQMPLLEWFIFSQRSYSDRGLNKLLLINGSSCMIGPFSLLFLIH